MYFIFFVTVTTEANSTLFGGFDTFEHTFFIPEMSLIYVFEDEVNRDIFVTSVAVMQHYIT
jgi:hypothetical protein